MIVKVGCHMMTLDEMRGLKMKTIDWQAILVTLSVTLAFILVVIFYLGMPTVIQSHHTGEYVGCEVGLDQDFLTPDDPECADIIDKGRFELEIWP